MKWKNKKQQAAAMIRMKQMNVYRVPYGREDTPADKREYNTGMGTPVGTVKEWTDYAKSQGISQITFVDGKKRIVKRISVKSMEAKDTDRDGVPDRKDCNPNDPNEQGFLHDVKMKTLKWQEARLEKKNQEQQAKLNDKLDELKERRAIAEKKNSIKKAELAQTEAIAKQIREEREKREKIEKQLKEANEEIEKTSLKGKIKRFGKTVGEGAKATAAEIKRFANDPQTKKAVRDIFADKPKRKRRKTKRKKAKRKTKGKKRKAKKRVKEVNIIFV